MYYVSTVAGEGYNGHRDGSPLTARFHRLYGITVDAQDNLIVVDSLNCMIRRVSKETVSTVAAGHRGHFKDDAFNSLFFITTLQSGDLIVSDYNHIKKIAPSGEVSTLYTDKDWMVYVKGMTVDSQGNIIFSRGNDISM